MFNPASFSNDSFAYHYQDGSSRITRSVSLRKWANRNGGAPNDNSFYWDVND